MKLYFPHKLKVMIQLAHLSMSLIRICFRLGAKAKLETFDSYNEASFCGVCFGSSDGSIVKDPIKVLLDFGYANYVYLRCSHSTRLKLIRAKSLSLLYSYPGCPILKSLAQYGLRITSQISNKHALFKRMKNVTGTYEIDMWRELLSVDFNLLAKTTIHLDSRIMVERKFGISLFHQTEIENYLDSKQDLSPIDFPLIADLAGSQRSLHYERYVKVLVGEHDVEKESSMQFISNHQRKTP